MWGMQRLVACVTVATAVLGTGVPRIVSSQTQFKTSTRIVQITTVFREGAGYDPERLLKTIRGPIGVR